MRPTRPGQPSIYTPLKSGRCCRTCSEEQDTRDQSEAGEGVHWTKAGAIASSTGPSPPLQWPRLTQSNHSIDKFFSTMPVQGWVWILEARSQKGFFPRCQAFVCRALRHHMRGVATSPREKVIFEAGLFAKMLSASVLVF